MTRQQTWSSRRRSSGPTQLWPQIPILATPRTQKSPFSHTIALLLSLGISSSFWCSKTSCVLIITKLFHLLASLVLQGIIMPIKTWIQRWIFAMHQKKSLKNTLKRTEQRHGPSPHCLLYEPYQVFGGNGTFYSLQISRDCNTIYSLRLYHQGKWWCADLSQNFPLLRFRNSRYTSASLRKMSVCKLFPKISLPTV